MSSWRVITSFAPVRGERAIPHDLKNATAALIVAAGRGSRVGSTLPKQYLKLAGRPILTRTIEAFLAAEAVRALVVVIHPDDVNLYSDALEGLSDPRVLPPVLGGETRTASVRNGLRALSGSAPSRVLIHDAARPFVTLDIIRRVDAALSEADGAFAAIPVVDALWASTDGYAEAPVPRDGIWRAQTPQGFDFDKICAAHEATELPVADDVAVARAAGMRVKIVMGDEQNFKITTPADLARAEAIIGQS